MAGPMAPDTRSRRILRRLLPAVVAVALLVWLVATVLGGGSTTTSATTTTPPPHTTTTTTTTTTVPTTTTTSAGSLPQTAAYPSSTSPQFQAAMTDLFGAVAHGTPPTAADAFFPEAAYVQLGRSRCGVGLPGPSGGRVRRGPGRGH